MRLVGYIVEVAGLSPKVTEKELHDFFSCCGKIEHLDIARYGDHLCTAYVTFRGPYAVDTAVLLSGSTIGNQRVSISRLEAPVDESVPVNNNFSKGTQWDQFVSAPAEATTVAEYAGASLIARGYQLSKDALMKAKAFDESHQISSTAAGKAVELSIRIGINDKISSGVEAVKSVDENYHVSDVTMPVASFTGRTVVATANAVVNSSYFAKGALWVADVLDRASKAAADFGNQGAQQE